MIQVGLALRVATPQRPPSATYKKKKPPFSPLSVLQDHLQFQLPIEQLASVPRAEQHPIAMAQDLARRCGAADEAFFREAMASPAAAATERESRRTLSYGTAGFRRNGSRSSGWPSMWYARRCAVDRSARELVAPRRTIQSRTMREARGRDGGYPAREKHMRPCPARTRWT